MVAETVWGENVSISMLAKKYPQWSYFNLSAIATEDNDILGREIGEPLCEAILPLAELREIERNAPTTFGALYQGNPVNEKATYFEKAKLGISLDMPALPKLENPIKLISLDTASEVSDSADYTVASHWLIYKDYWIINKIDKMKVNFTDLLDYYDRRCGDADYVICEKASSGLQLLQLRQDIIASTVFKDMTDKEAHAKAFNELLGTKVFVQPTELTEDIKAEILSFPFAAHDDSVLSLLHGYRFLINNELIKKAKRASRVTAGKLLRRANLLK